MYPTINKVSKKKKISKIVSFILQKSPLEGKNLQWQGCVPSPTEFHIIKILKLKFLFNFQGTSSAGKN